MQRQLTGSLGASASWVIVLRDETTEPELTDKPQRSRRRTAGKALWNSQRTDRHQLLLGPLLFQDISLGNKQHFVKKCSPLPAEILKMLNSF